MRKIVLTAIIILALFNLLVAGMPLVEVANANPYMHEYVEEGVIPPPEGTIPPVILVTSPTNNTAYNSNDAALNFNISFSKTNNVSLSLTELYYRTSWQKINNYVDLHALFIKNNYTYPNLFSVNFTNIPEGPRWIEIYAAAKVFAYETFHEIKGAVYTQHYVSYGTVSSAFVNFTIDMTPPRVSILSIENKTYNGPDIPLEYGGNEPISLATYALDGQDNVTINGNSTLTALPEGSHSIVVYANDTAGNQGASDIINFKIDTSTPTPAPSDTPAQPSPKITTGPFSPDPPDNTGWYIIVSIVTLAAIIAASAAIYFKKYHPRTKLRIASLRMSESTVRSGFASESSSRV